MLRNDIIRKSKTDRKAYELFALLGCLYDSIDKSNINTVQVADDDEERLMAKVMRGTLVTLNDINFSFFHEIRCFIDFLDETHVFGRRPYSDSEIIKHITDILDKMCEFSWYKEVTGQPMTIEEIIELLNYDCDLEDFVEALASIEG